MIDLIEDARRFPKYYLGEKEAAAQWELYAQERQRDLKRNEQMRENEALTQGITCYERDEALCTEMNCVLFGCQLRSKAERTKLVGRVLQWRPIETAPRSDAAWVLLFGATVEPKYDICHWDADTQCWLAGSGELWSEEGKYGPTHWMHLPEAPK